ncbi:unnamed protein product [Pleuronectes platessa]|uniref:Uncharacterized protein n=1 Tax=Pleuronectes platessa TaxID=8262 RepID=A0A9N7V4L8_PLEPL|nr:unnamed protein product [Pleuronectes platessa]
MNVCQEPWKTPSSWVNVVSFLDLCPPLRVCLDVVSRCHSGTFTDEESWSRVNMLWNVNCLHDNSPVSSFRLWSSGPTLRTPDQSHEVTAGVEPCDIILFDIWSLVHREKSKLAPPRCKAEFYLEQRPPSARNKKRPVSPQTIEQDEGEHSRAVISFHGDSWEALSRVSFESGGGGGGAEALFPLLL